MLISPAALSRSSSSSASIRANSLRGSGCVARRNSAAPRATGAGSGGTRNISGTTVYQPRFDPEQFLELVDKYKVTSTHLVPTMITRNLRLLLGFTSFMSNLR